MPKIFLSYRRDDTGDVAQRLGRKLKDDLGLDNVFLDAYDIWGGEDWRAILARQIRNSEAVIALIGPRWAGGPDGRRIFDDDDIVRWELRLALDARRGIVPTMVDGARLPGDLPHDIAGLSAANWIDLNPADSLLRYQELLADVFYKAVRKEGDVVIVTDGTAEAMVHLRKLAALMKGGELDDGRRLVRAAARGFAAVSLRDAAVQWPDVIVLQSPDGPNNLLTARERGIGRNTARVAVISATTASLLSFVAARATAPPPEVAAQALSSAGPGATSGPSSTGWWSSLTVGVQSIVLAGVAATAITLGVMSQPDPFESPPDQEEQPSTLDLAEGAEKAETTVIPGQPSVGEVCDAATAAARDRRPDVRTSCDRDTVAVRSAGGPGCEFNATVFVDVTSADGGSIVNDLGQDLGSATRTEILMDRRDGVWQYFADTPGFVFTKTGDNVVEGEIPCQPLPPS